MANVKISQLPAFTGNTTGSWLIMNNSGETQTFKVLLSNVLQSGTSGTSGTSGQSGSSGTSGINGSSGTSGINGSSGTSGTSGQSGSSGSSGTSGINGSSGTSGTASIVNNNDTYVLTATGTSGIIRGEQKFRYNNTTEQFICSGSMTLTGNTHQIIGGTNINGSLNVTGSIQRPFNVQSSFTGTTTYSFGTGSLAANFVQSKSQGFSLLSLIGSGSNDQAALGLQNSKGYTDLARFNDDTSLVNSTTNTGSFTVDGFSKVVVKDPVEITGSINITNKLNLTAQNPLPAGVLGDLAVSSSNALYFHNGTDWNLIS